MFHSKLSPWFSTISSLETMSLRGMRPEIKLPINVTKGQCHCKVTYIFKILAIKSIRTQLCIFNLPPLMNVLTDFLLIKEISTAFYFSISPLKVWPTIAAKICS